MTFDHYIICKRAVDKLLVRQIVQELHELGRSDMIVHSEGEPAIVAVQNKSQSMRDSGAIPRNPLAYNSQSNCPCEKAV